MTDKELMNERNALARQLADLRDEMAGLRQELLDAQQTAVMWSQWAEDTANKANGDITEVRNDQGTDAYEDMLTGAQRALEKVKDHWYDVGYAIALKELRDHWYDAIGDWADKQGVGEHFRTP